jgi:hypothetical protein
MDQDINIMDILMNDSFAFYLGVPHIQEAMDLAVIGSPNSNTTVYNLANYPLYCQNPVGITPTAADVLVQTVSGGTATNLALALSEPIQDVTDSLGNSVPGAVKLAAAPGSGVTPVATYYEQLEPFIAQDITPAVKQNVKKVEKLGDTNIMYGYGSIDISLKSDQIISNDSMEMFQKLMFQNYSGNQLPESGYNAYQMLTKPISLFAHIPVTDYNDEVIGIFKFAQCKLSPTFPGVKAGDTGKFTLDMSIQENPTLLVPSVAV